MDTGAAYPIGQISRMLHGLLRIEMARCPVLTLMTAATAARLGVFLFFRPVAALSAEGRVV